MVGAWRGAVAGAGAPCVAHPLLFAAPGAHGRARLPPPPAPPHARALPPGPCLPSPQVENFKSYRGQQHVGPFRSFTAIVGPNGSGKSNLMDAISFVLGVRTSQLRGSLRELLYANSEAGSEEERPRRGYVRLVYRTDEGQEVAFSRHIQPAGASAGAAEQAYQSVYRINERHVSWEAYSQRLATFGIRVKVRNFLVFQVSRARAAEGVGRVQGRGKAARAASEGPPRSRSRDPPGTSCPPRPSSTTTTTRCRQSAAARGRPHLPARTCLPLAPPPARASPAQTKNLGIPPHFGPHFRATSRPWPPSPRRA